MKLEKVGFLYRPWWWPFKERVKRLESGKDYEVKDDQISLKTAPEKGEKLYVKFVVDTSFKKD